MASDHALAICDRCKVVVPYNDLRRETIDGADRGLKVCEKCWDPEHPQLRLRDLELTDPQPLDDPRPDHYERTVGRRTCSFAPAAAGLTIALRWGSPLINGGAA